MMILALGLIHCFKNDDNDGNGCSFVMAKPLQVSFVEYESVWNCDKERASGNPHHLTSGKISVADWRATKEKDFAIRGHDTCRSRR